MNRFRTYLERETGTTMMKVRKPAKIVDGRLLGSEISRWGPGVWRVWTSRVKLARKVAGQYALSFRPWDGECELYVPDGLAVQLLPQFGAWRRRNWSEKAKEDARARIAVLNNSLKARSLGSNAEFKALPQIQPGVNG